MVRRARYWLMIALCLPLLVAVSIPGTDVKVTTPGPINENLQQAIDNGHLGGSGSWPPSGTPADLLDGDQVGGSVPSAAAGPPVNGVTTCTVLNELYIDTTSTVIYRCTNVGAKTWVKAAYGDAAVDGTLERDEVTPEWTHVIDCTSLSATACQDAWYAVFRPVMESVDTAAFDAQMPMNVKVILGAHTCTPDTATDFGELRACFAFFPSGPFAGSPLRPTPSLHSFNPSRGRLRIHFEKSVLSFDANDGAGGHAEQDEGTCGLLLGGEYINGFRNADPADATYWGDIPGTTIDGNLTTRSLDSWSGNSSGPDWDAIAGGAGHRPPTGNFENAIVSSKTSFFGVCYSGLTQMFISDFHHVHQHSGGDYDDLGFACMGDTFSNTRLGSFDSMSGNGFWIGPRCQLEIASGSIEGTGGPSDRFGGVLGSQLQTVSGSRIPMSATCGSTFCGPKYGFTFNMLLDGGFIAEGMRTAQLATFGAGIVGNIYVEGGAATDDPRVGLCTALNRPWGCCTGVGAGTCRAKGVILGAGFCAADASICVVNEDCPGVGNAGCAASASPWPCCSGAGTGTCGTPTNASCTGNEAPFLCCTGAGAGACTGNQCVGYGATRNTQVASNITGAWTGGVFLGLGPNARSPYPESGAHLDSVRIASDGFGDANLFCTAASAPYSCCTGVGTGICANIIGHNELFGDNYPGSPWGGSKWPPAGNPNTWGNPAASLDFSQMDGKPAIDGRYYGYFVPPSAEILDRDCGKNGTSPSDRGSAMVLNQICTVDGRTGPSDNKGNRFQCNPALSGADPSTCDAGFGNEMTQIGVGWKIEAGELAARSITIDNFALEQFCVGPNVMIEFDAAGTPSCIPTPAGGGGGGDITDVWDGCTTGNCNALTAGATDTLDAGSAGSSKPAKRGTVLPGTCVEGDLFQDTDSGGSETYVCTAANTWVKLNAPTDNAATATALAADGANCGAGSVAGGVGTDGAAQSCIDPLVTTEMDSVTEYSAVMGITGTANANRFHRGDNVWIAPTALDGANDNLFKWMYFGGTNGACGASDFPCWCATTDSGTTALGCFNKWGEPVTQNNQSTVGNLLKMFGNNDVALATDPTCANKFSDGEYGFTDAKAATTNPDFCYGTAAHLRWVRAAANSAYLYVGSGTPAPQLVTGVGDLEVAGKFEVIGASLLATLELGHLSDTTLARASAGILSVEGKSLPRIVVSGTSALGSGSVTNGTCATLVTTAASGAVNTTDSIVWSWQADPGTNMGLLNVKAFVTTNNVNFQVCNPTAGALTPTAGTLNWQVLR